MVKVIYLLMSVDTDVQLTCWWIPISQFVSVIVWLLCFKGWNVNVQVLFYVKKLKKKLFLLKESGGFGESDKTASAPTGEE